MGAVTTINDLLVFYCSPFVEITPRLKYLGLGNYMTNRYLRIQQSNKLLLNEVDNSGMGGIGLTGSRVRNPSI